MLEKAAMSAIDLSTTVNQHYLNKVMGLTEVMEVAASEDIVDIRGRKLVAKGTRLTRAQQSTLGLHKLKKTLESTLVAEGAIDAARLVDEATRILDTSAPLRLIVGAAGGSGPSPLALLSYMRFGHAMGMMLTLTDRGAPAALEHSITVSLLSICMAKKMGLGDDDQMVAALAGLLHDIGELYIDPAYLRPGQRLLPHEWAHLVVHPRIGQMLISELESYPTAVGRAVAEHHERQDATGYPRQLGGANLSDCGTAVSAAEMVAGVLLEDHPLERAELALKIVPGEHPRASLAAISTALQAQDKLRHGSPLLHEEHAVERLSARMHIIVKACDALAAGPLTASARSPELLKRALVRVKAIERAFISTGLDFYLSYDHLLGDADGAMLFEKAVASREIAWRLRDIARDMALMTAASPEETRQFAELISLLDDPAANDAGAPAAPTLPDSALPHAA